MSRVQPNYSRKTGELLNFKWIALLGRDENKKQIQVTKRVPPTGKTPKAELKEQQRLADAWEIEERKKNESSRDSLEERRRKEKERETITLESFIDTVWMPKHVKDGSHTPDSVSFYHYMSEDIKAYFKEKHPGIKLREITVATVLDYISFLRNEARTKKGEPYRPTTIQHHFSTLRNILEVAVYREYIAEDPCKKIRPNDRPQRDETEIDFLSEDEATKFFAALDSQAEIDYWKQKTVARTYLTWKTMVNLFILTGLRRGELVGLQWGDLDEKSKMFNVRRNVTMDSSAENKIHIGETKGKRGRKVAISKYVLDLLADLKAEQKKELGADVLPNAYIFQSLVNPYQPIFPTEPTRLMAKFVKRHNLRGISVHDLRHSAASIAIQSGANVKQIQALLGHKDPALSLKYYIGITESAQVEVAEGIESKVRPPKGNQEKAE